MEEVEDRSPRLGLPAAAVLLATVLLSGAISYNAVWRRALVAPVMAAADLASDSSQQGSARVVVAVDEPQTTTITLRYDQVVESVQRELAASGIYNGPIDGVSGRRTQLAIISYQRMHDLDPTGAATPELVDHIELSRQFAEAAGTTASLPAAGDAAAGNIRSVQAKLAELGYEPDASDGELGLQTRLAIRQFQEDHGIAPDGEVSDALVAELNKAVPQAQRRGQ